MLWLRVLRGAPPAAAAPLPRGRCSATGRMFQLAIPAAVSLSLVPCERRHSVRVHRVGIGSRPHDAPAEFLEKWNAKNQKMYAEFDSRFKSSKVLKELLEKSKQNKQKNERQIQDKYCLRGAE